MMKIRTSLDLKTSHGCWSVDTESGTRFLLDLDQGAALREPLGGRRSPWDGVFLPGARLVEASGRSLIEVGAQARWQFDEQYFMFAGRVTRITPHRALGWSELVVAAPVESRNVLV
jgi:hypothetical protein